MKFGKSLLRDIYTYIKIAILLFFFFHNSTSLRLLKLAQVYELLSLYRIRGGKLHATSTSAAETML